MFQAWLVKMAKIAAHSAPNVLPGKRREEERHREGQEAQHRHRLQDVERGQDEQLGAPALGGERRHDESEDQRSHDGGEHAQHRAQGIFRQVGGIEAHRLAGKPRGGRGHLAAHRVRSARRRRRSGRRSRCRRDWDESRRRPGRAAFPLHCRCGSLSSALPFRSSTVAPTGKRERECLDRRHSGGLDSPGTEAGQRRHDDLDRGFIESLQ